MKVGEYRKQWLKDRKEKALKFWRKVLKDFNKGLSPQKIAAKYKNPITGKSYTVAHIYLILHTMENNKVKVSK